MFPKPQNITCGDTNKQICDAYNCEYEATEQIEVSAGKFGYITLYVCTNCLPKFLDNERRR